MRKTNLLAKARDFVLSHRRLAQSALAVCLFAGALAFSAQPLSAEGTVDTLNSSRDNFLALYKDTDYNNKAVNKESVNNGTFDTYMSLWKLQVDDSPSKRNSETQNVASSFGGVSRQLKVKFYAYEGETVFIGSSSYHHITDAVLTLPDNTKINLNFEDDEGHIKSKDAYINGPNGVHKAILDEKGIGSSNNPSPTSNGYDAFTYNITQSGVYIIDFYADGDNGGDGNKMSFAVGDNILANNNNEYSNLYAFDVTVCKKTVNEESTTYNAVSGRVWLDAFVGQMLSGTNQGMFGYLYTTTRDGYVWRFAFNGIQPYTIAMYANQRGGISTATNASAYHSVHSPIDNYTDFTYYKNMTDKNGNKDGIMIYGPDNETTDIDAPDHMFFNYPDPNLPESIVPKNANADFKVDTISFDGRDPLESEIVDEDGNVDESGDNSGTVGVGGYFNVGTTGATSYRVIIDMSNMYARFYHGESDNSIGYGSSHPEQRDHDEEICLSAPYKKDGDEAHINFIYFDSGKWYNIQSKVTEGSGYDMHPVNKIGDKDVSNLVEYKELSPAAVEALGLPKNPDGQEEIGNGEHKFKSLGKIMLGNAAVDERDDRVYWNGRDQWGRILPVGEYFGKTGRGKVYAEAKAGEVHFPISDAEAVKNGLAVWLMNPPSTVLNTVGEGNSYYKSKSDLCSKLFYNNREKSLLRDYVVALPNIESPQENGTLATVWNLPSSIGNSAAGLGSKGSGKSELNLKWYSRTDFNSDFEDVSIEGKASYSDDLGTKLTGTAAKISGDGVDHGIFDVWTHVISPVQVTLNEPIVLYHFADRKIITGFVYLDTPEKGADRGVYDRMTNDHELEGAIIVAEYGDSSPEYKDNTTGPRWVHYEAKTDTDGYYSIPVDLTAFNTSKLEKVDDVEGNYIYPVTIWVYYNENISGAITHKVTTIGTKSAPSSDYDYFEKQEFDNFPSEYYGNTNAILPAVSMQAVNIPKYIHDKRDNTQNVYLKEIYAGQVGYVAEPTGEALNITKKWEPSYLKSTSLKASFTIVGMKSGARTKVEDFFKDHSEGITVKELVDGKLVTTIYSTTLGNTDEYKKKYACDENGEINEETGKNIYMAIEHDPAFPSNDDISKIYKAVRNYNLSHTAAPITMEEVIVNGHNFGDGNIFDSAPKSGDPETSDYIYVVENATTEEARGGIYTNKILPAYTYKIVDGAAKEDGTIVYRVYENPMLNEKGEDVSTDNTVSRIKNDWTYTNMLSTVDYTLTVYYDHNGDGKFNYKDAEGKDSNDALNYGDKCTLIENGDVPIKGATVYLIKMDGSGGGAETDQFSYTLSDEQLLSYDNDDMRDLYKERTSKDALNSGTSELSDEYKQWLGEQIDEDTKTNGVQKIWKNSDSLPTDKYGHVTFTGLATGVYRVYVKYSTTEEYNTVTVTGKKDSVEIVEQKDFNAKFDSVKDHTFAQRLDIKNDFSSEIGLGFEVEVDLRDIFDLEKLLKINGRPGGVSSETINLTDKTFTATVDAEYTGTTTPPVSKPFVEIKYPTTSKDNFTAEVEKYGDKKAFDIEGTKIVFHTPGEYKITFNETKGTYSYITYDSVEKSTTVNVQNEAVDGAPNITIKDGDTDLLSNPKKIIFTNKYNTGSVKVTKTVDGKSAYADDTFTFTFKISDADGTESYPIAGAGSKTIKDADTFTLKDGESIVIYDLPKDAKVTVTETSNNAYTTTVDSTESYSKEVTIADAQQTIAFTNTHKEGSLKISEAVTVGKHNPALEDGGKYPKETFDFKVTLKDTSGKTPDKFDFDLPVEITGDTGTKTLKFTDGVANLTLSDGQSATISSLPNGWTADVKQTNKPAGYTVKPESAVQSPKIETGKTATAEFTNEFPTGSLTVDVSVVGDDITAYPELKFTVKLTPPKDVPLLKEYDGKKVTVNEDGTYSFTVSGLTADSHEYKALLNSLPVGTSYKITAPTVDGYVLTIMEKDTGTITAGNTSAEFVYSRIPEVTIPVTKTLTGDFEKDKEYSFDFAFEVSGNDPALKLYKDGAEKSTVTITNTKLTDTLTLSGKFPIDYNNFSADKSSVEYKYTVSETKGDNPCVTYDSKTYTVTVTVTRGDDGKLTATSSIKSTATSSVDSIGFANTYTPKLTTLALSVQKTVTIPEVHIPLPAGHEYTFSFKLSGKEQDGMTLPEGDDATVSVGPFKADMYTGSATSATLETTFGEIGKIKFTKAGTYTFNVAESGMTIDKNPEPEDFEEIKNDGFTSTGGGKVTVVVKDDNGQLTVESVKIGSTDITESKTVPFTNSYSTDGVDFTLNISKTLEAVGNVLMPNPGDYTFGFDIKFNGATVGEVSHPHNVEYNGDTKKYSANEVFDDFVTFGGSEFVGSDGSIVKPAAKPLTINFTEPGDYEFVISENITRGGEKVDSATFDGYEAKTHKLTVHVEDIGGHLKISGYTLDSTDTANSGTGYGATATVSVFNKYTPRAAELTLNIAKSLAGNDLPSGHDYKFNFALAEGGTNLGTVEFTPGNLSDAKTIKLFTYDHAGTYTYSLSETVLDGPASASGFTSDPGDIEITVEVVDNNGGLSVKSVTGDKVAFDAVEKTATVSYTNTYTPKSTTLALGVQKTVTIPEVHIPLPAGHEYTFSFTLSGGGDGAALPENTSVTVGKFSASSFAEGATSATLPGNSTATFDDITFTKAGTYTFNVAESGMDIVADEGSTSVYGHGFSAVGGASKTVTVTVADNGGTLSVSSVMLGKTKITDNIVPFTNKYSTAGVDFTLNVEKTLEAVGGVLMPNPGYYTFGFDINFNGATVDGESHPHTVKYNGGTKEYRANEAYKNFVTFSGADFAKSGDTKSGSLTINFTEPGDYEFVISETINGEATNPAFNNGDANTHTLTVSVEDVGGHLWVKEHKIDGVENNNNTVSITNSYAPASVSVDDKDASGEDRVVTVAKTLKTVDGEPVKFPEKFSFTADVSASEGGVYEWKDGKNVFETDGGENGEGSVSITGLTFRSAGVYTVTLTENDPSDSRVEKDARTFSVTYTVVDKGGKLSIDKVEYDKEFVFENTFTPEAVSVELEFTKKLTDTLTGGDRLGIDTENPRYDYFKNLYGEKFSFTLTPDGEYGAEHITLDGEAPAAKTAVNTENTAKNGTPNLVDFGKLEFKRTGTYVFTVRENTPNSLEGWLPKVNYDGRTVTATYTVTLDGETGELEVTAHFTADGETVNPEFENTYGPEPCILTVTNNLAQTVPDGIAYDMSRDFTYHITLSGAYIKESDKDKSDGDETVTFAYFYEKPAAAIDAEEDGSEVQYIVFTKTDADTYETDVTIPLNHSVVIEGIPHHNTAYTVEQRLSADDASCGYSFINLVEEYKGKDAVLKEDEPVESGRFALENDYTVITFNNRYTVTPLDYDAPEIEKIMQGRELNESDSFGFTAELSGGAVFKDGGVKKTVTLENGASLGKIGAIVFDRPGEYTLTVSEKVPTGDLFGVTYSEEVYTVEYSVTDENADGVKDGKLHVTAVCGGESAPEKLSFTNIYAPEATDEVFIAVSKTVEPSDKTALPHAEEYRFKASDGENVFEGRIALAEGELSGSTEISLGRFDEVGSYEFTVTESAGDTLGMIYDESGIKVTVDVTDDLKGKLVYSLSAEEVGFTNEYRTGGISITKEISGIGAEEEQDFEFTLRLSDKSGAALSDSYPASDGRTLSSGDKFTLRAGDELIISGIPEGAGVEVEETENSDYVASVNGGADGENVFEGVISSEETAEAGFMNRFVGKPASRFDDFVFKTQKSPEEGMSAKVGDTVTYEISWINPEKVDADIVITDSLDAGVEYIGSTGGGEYDGETGTVTWRILAKGLEEGSVEVTVKVTEDAAGFGAVSNGASAEIWTHYPDDKPDKPTEPDYTDETDEPVVTPVVSVGITKSESLNGGEPTDSVKARAGDTVKYELSVTASGADAQNVTVVDIVPKGLTPAEISISDGGKYDPATGTVRWTLGALEQDGTKTVSYSVVIPEVGEYAVWESKGYVYSGSEATPEGVPEEGYPWISSETVSAAPVEDLVIKKTVAADGGAVPEGVKFRFTVNLYDQSGLPASGAIYESGAVKSAVSEGTVKINLGAGETLTVRDLPAGTVYKISEEPVTNYTPDPSNVYDGSLTNKDRTVEIINNYSFTEEKLGDITVTNAVIGSEEDSLRRFAFTLTLADSTVNGTYGDLEFVAGQAEFGLMSGEAVTASGLPADVGYTVEESTVSAEGFSVNDSGNTAGTVPADGAVTVMFLNERAVGAVGGITVRNTVIGGARAFNFAVTARGADGPIVGQFGDMTFDASGTAVFSLAGGESMTAAGLPSGTQYTVAETDADSDGYVTSFTDDSNGVVPRTANALVEFMNIRTTGSLTVKNTVVGGERVFGFTVLLDDQTVSGLYGELWFDAGLASFELAGGQSVSITGLPAGVRYVVTETDANADGYATSSTGENGVIPENMNASASFVNTLKQPSALIVSKTVVGGEAGERFGFEITLTGADGLPLEGEFGPVTTDAEGHGTFVLSDGESAVIPLPEGSAYSVAEIPDPSVMQRYDMTSAGMTNGVIDPEGASVSFINTMRTGSLTVTNTVGGNAADMSRSFEFTVTAPVTGVYGDMFFDETGTAVFSLEHGRSMTATGLPADAVITVAENDANTDGYVTTADGLPYSAPITKTVISGVAEKAVFGNIRQIEDTASFGTLTVINNIIGTTTDEKFVFEVVIPAYAADPASISLDGGMSSDYGIALMSAYDGIFTDAEGNTHVEFRLGHGESKRINGIPAGAPYTVTETGNLYYVTSSVGSTGVIPGGGSATAVFVNRWNVGGLSLRVNVEDDTGAAVVGDRAEFTYRVTIEGVGEGFVYPSHITDSYGGALESGSKVLTFDGNGVAEVTLGAGETAIAPDLPAGYSYKVENIGISDGLHYLRSESGSSGTVETGKQSEAVFDYYIATGTVSIEKDYKYNSYGMPLRTREYFESQRFEVVVRLTGADGLPLTGSYVYDGSTEGTVSDGGSIWLRGGEKVTLRGLPEGAEYRIYEVGLPRSIRQIDSENTSGTVTAGENAAVKLVNMYIGPYYPQSPTYPSLPSAPTPSGGVPETPVNPPETESVPDEPVEIERPTEGKRNDEDA